MTAAGLPVEVPTGLPAAGIGAAVRLDVLTVRPYARQLLLVLSSMVLIGVVGGPAPVLLMTGAVFSALIAAYPFAVADKNDLGTLHAVLPVHRGTWVLARYTVSLGAYLLATAVATLLAMALAGMRDEVVVPAELIFVAGVGFLLYAVLVGLQLPVYYALGYTKGRLLGYLPIMLLSAGLAMGGVLDGAALSGLDAWLTGHGAVAAGLAVGAGAVLLVASALLSWWLDGRRQVRVG